MKPMGFLQCVCLALVLGGCLSLGDTQATRFYVLTPLTDSDAAMSPTEEKAEARQPMLMALAPVIVPRYLDRPQIVTRINDNELRLAEFEQWAEPLPDSVTQVLAENLTRLLSVHRIEVLPELRDNRSAYQVGVTLMRFECDAANACVLQARWTLVKGRDEEVRVQNAFEVRIPREVPGYDAIVGTLSRALGALSRDIALHVRAVVTHGGAG